jgi:hypothetical protein
MRNAENKSPKALTPVRWFKKITALHMEISQPVLPLARGRNTSGGLSFFGPVFPKTALRNLSHGAEFFQPSKWKFAVEPIINNQTTNIHKYENSKT